MEPSKKVKAVNDWPSVVVASLPVMSFSFSVVLSFATNLVAFSYAACQSPRETDQCV
jgi:hypothetical protein